MATVAPQSERRTSFSPNDRKASASLREMPSYKAEASRALNRQEDLKSLSKRLSSNRDLLNADPSTKPWLKFRSISRTENLTKGMILYQNYVLFIANAEKLSLLIFYNNNLLMKIKQLVFKICERKKHI